MGLTPPDGLLSVFVYLHGEIWSYAPVSITRSGENYMPVLGEGQWHLGASASALVPRRGHEFCVPGSRILYAESGASGLEFFVRSGSRILRGLTGKAALGAAFFGSALRPRLLYGLLRALHLG